MVRSFCRRSIEIISGCRVQALRASLLLACAALCTCCTPSEESRVSALEKKNEELRQELEEASKKYITACNLLGDIADKLASMTAKEAEIRGLQEELDPATYEVSEDLRKEIFANLKSIEDRLGESEEKERQFSDLIGTDPRYTTLRRTADSFRVILNEKERVIEDLKVNLERLAARAAELKKEVDEGQDTIVKLEQRGHENDARADQQEEIIAALRRETGSAYYLVGSQQDIHGALESGEIARKWWTYRVSDRILAAGEVPQRFQTISPEATELNLGSDLKRARILSDHKHYDALFYITHKGSSWVLKLHNPLQFWRVSRFLIIEVQR